jgi:hypothetical protein
VDATEVVDDEDSDVVTVIVEQDVITDLGTDASGGGDLASGQRGISEEQSTDSAHGLKSSAHSLQSCADGL